jgi:predicted HTH domain antitoxin
MEHHLRLMAALKLFELGKISSGKAAELAGMSRVEFLEVCGRYRVSVFNYSDEELESELHADLAVLEDALPRGIMSGSSCLCRSG